MLEQRTPILNDVAESGTRIKRSPYRWKFTGRGDINGEK